MLSLSSLGALFFRGGLVRKVITGYSGDTFPNFTPNPVFAGAYERGEVEVEHWSFLAFSQRLEAGARGLPAIVTRSIAGSSMEANDGYARVETPFGQVGLLAPLQADVALLHAPIADRAGNVALQPPLLEGVWGALGRAPGRHRDRRADRRRHPALVAPRADPGAPGAGGGGVPDGRPSRRVLRRRACPSRATARTTTSGSRPGRRPAATTTTPGSSAGCSTCTTQEQWVEQLGAERVQPPARQGRSRLVAGRRGGVPSRSREPGERVGATRRYGVPATWPIA